MPCCIRTWSVVFGSFLLVAFAATAFQGRLQAAAEAPESAAQEPVEEDPHEFMEYYFQPAYQRLREAMQAAPQNNAGWKTIKADGLLLAEGGNLLLTRAPSEDTEDWNKFSQQVRQAGTQLYQAGKAKDFAAARKAYEGMLQRCNACHDQFADGEHQLMP